MSRTHSAKTHKSTETVGDIGSKTERCKHCLQRFSLAEAGTALMHSLGACVSQLAGNRKNGPKTKKKGRKVSRQRKGKKK